MDLIQGTVSVATTRQTDDVWAIQSAHQYITAISRGVDFEKVYKGIVKYFLYNFKFISKLILLLLRYSAEVDFKVILILVTSNY